jgi:hypothetical protein
MISIHSSHTSPRLTWARQAVVGASGVKYLANEVAAAMPIRRRCRCKTTACRLSASIPGSLGGAAGLGKAQGEGRAFG